MKLGFDNPELDAIDFQILNALQDHCRTSLVKLGEQVGLSAPSVIERIKKLVLDNKDKGPWARVAVPMAGMACGFYFIPDIDDEVLVAFEHGDLDRPFVLGGLWNSDDPPPESVDARLSSAR